MKAITLGVLSAAALVFSVAAAPAADSSAYMAQCKENSESGQLPPNMTANDVTDMCSCIVDEVGDNQGVIDEMTEMSEEMSKATPEERQARMQNGPPPSQEAQAAFRTCAPAGMGPPPQQ